MPREIFFKYTSFFSVLPQKHFDRYVDDEYLLKIIDLTLIKFLNRFNSGKYEITHIV